MLTEVPTNYTFASLVSVEQIKKYMPWLYRLIKKDDRILSFVTNTIPSLLVVSFNSVLPFLLECTRNVLVSTNPQICHTCRVSSHAVVSSSLS